MGAWMICVTFLAYCLNPGKAYQVSEPSSERTVTVTTKPITFGNAFNDVIIGSGKADVQHSAPIFKPSKQLFSNVALRPEYSENSRKILSIYDDVGFMSAIQQQLPLKNPEQLFTNLFVLPPQTLTYNFDQASEAEENNSSEPEETKQLSSETGDQGVSETMIYSHPVDSIVESSNYPIEHYGKKKQKEVHYHQHKHLHDHDHKQEHVHKHQQEHLHDHKHGHKHEEGNQHHHQAHHDHHHKDEHWHSHKGDHHHDHEGKHHHDHKQDHKHEHWHEQKHDHHDDHKHEHSHHGKHHHEVHSEHKHKHEHGHDHHGKHKHNHHNEHKHSHNHKHSGHHHHSHHNKHEHYHKSRSHPYKIYIKKYHHGH